MPDRVGCSTTRATAAAAASAAAAAAVAAARAARRRSQRLIWMEMKLAKAIEHRLGDCTQPGSSATRARKVQAVVLCKAVDAKA